MLSEETALGEFPTESVKMMARIASFCETTSELRKVELPVRTVVDTLTESAARMTGDDLEMPIKAVVTFTRSGATTKTMTRYRLPVPIVAICNDQKVINQLCLSYGVVPYYNKFKGELYATEDPIFESLIDSGFLKSKDTVAVIHGDLWFGRGMANRLSIRTL
jgi:pyruvate kinase